MNSKEYKRVAIYFFVVSWLVAFAIWLLIRVLFLLYGLPNQLNGFALEIFFLVGLSLMLVVGIMTFFSLFIYGKWKKMSFMDKVSAILGFAIIVPFFYLILQSLWGMARDLLILF